MAYTLLQQVRGLLNDLFTSPHIWSDDELTFYMTMASSSQDPDTVNPYDAAAFAYRAASMDRARLAMIHETGIFKVDMRTLPAALMQAAKDMMVQKRENPISGETIFAGSVTDTDQMFKRYYTDGDYNTPFDSQ